MSRLLVHVEGETEETFVRELLAPHLQGRGFQRVSARLLGNARNRLNRGGIKSWPSAREDILTRLKEDGGSFATTMVDYYALPSTPPQGWPGRFAARSLPFPQRGPLVQAGMDAEINEHFVGTATPVRFVGFVLMHEFEALLFSDCAAFAEGIGMGHLEPAFSGIRAAFPTPEEINDSPATAPSKRVEALVAGYQKPLYGNLAALHIGMPRMRAECPHFDAWVRRLEALI